VPHIVSVKRKRLDAPQNTEAPIAEKDRNPVPDGIPFAFFFFFFRSVGALLIIRSVRKVEAEAKEEERDARQEVARKGCKVDGINAIANSLRCYGFRFAVTSQRSVVQI
jgi:hypothetical protein